MSIASKPRISARTSPAPIPASKANSSLASQVYDQLRAEILSWELEPGRELSEAELAERFQVSKTPVREALAMLRLDGFVRTFPRRGYQVLPITFGDMKELFELRVVLECGAAELACERISDADLRQLDRLAKVSYDRSQRPSFKGFVDANRDFHLAIVKASQNQRLYDQVVKAIDGLERFFYLGARLRDVNSETQEDHEEILTALRARDGVMVREVVARHIEETRKGLIVQIASSTKEFERLVL